MLQLDVEAAGRVRGLIQSVAEDSGQQHEPFRGREVRRDLLHRLQPNLEVVRGALGMLGVGCSAVVGTSGRGDGRENRERE